MLPHGTNHHASDFAMKSSDGQIFRLTMQFAQAVCSTLRDMIGIEYTVQEHTLNNEPFSAAEGTISFVYFGGTVQGNCIIATSSTVAQRLMAVFQKKNGLDWSSENAAGVEDLINEVLNISVGQLMPFLEKEIEAVTYMSPIVLSGRVVFPRIASNRIEINGEEGPMVCVVSLNMVSQKITRTLQTLSDALVKKTELVFIDSLTGLKNRRYFDEVFPPLVDSGRKTGSIISLLLIDIDNFKSMNDLFGHQTGDLVLSMTAQSIGGSIREMDMACRYGGDEIVVILPDTVLPNARRVAKRIQYAINQNSLNLRKRITVLPEITISIGITQMHPRDSSDHFFSRADSALYSAKRNGRNRIETSPPDENHT